MDIERPYFSDKGEWTTQEREFAERAVRDIGLEAWNNLLAVRRKEGNDAFVKATLQIWPSGTPPELNQTSETDESGS